MLCRAQSDSHMLAFPQSLLPFLLGSSPAPTPCLVFLRQWLALSSHSCNSEPGIYLIGASIPAFSCAQRTTVKRSKNGKGSERLQSQVSRGFVDLALSVPAWSNPLVFSCIESPIQIFIQLCSHKRWAIPIPITTFSSMSPPCL